MSEAREQILGAIRRSLGRGAADEARRAAVAERLARHERNLVPARTQGLEPAALVALFVAMAEEAQATVARVACVEDVPAAVADYLAQNNLPTRLVMTPEPALDAVPWGERPLLEIRRGIAEDADQVGVTACFVGIAETGTLMLTSGLSRPTRNNFLPDTHVVIMRGEQVVGSYEEGWSRLRDAGQGMPRTVNLITGPSRTGDIEQRIELGAHGPRRLHIVLVDDEAQPQR